MTRHRVIIEETISQTFGVEMPPSEDPFDWVERNYSESKLVVENGTLCSMRYSIDDSEFVDFGYQSKHPQLRPTTICPDCRNEVPRGNYCIDCGSPLCSEAIDDSPYVKHYEDCYDGCGGEDCACCEIYQAHRDDALAIPEPCNDDFDIFGRSHIPYEEEDD